ncbi:hypothetical protein E2C01_069169 [Portunus trituberculatus]|uniref:Uncharacterized protein n=1 Tax=Portunus trituberculatus TaxID=210409 RepID=A0A5B7I231_PORTR|nr:hypothetical protein [Portunus trituberculatus]
MGFLHRHFSWQAHEVNGHEKLFVMPDLQPSEETAKDEKGLPLHLQSTPEPTLMPSATRLIQVSSRPGLLARARTLFVRAVCAGCLCVGGK